MTQTMNGVLQNKNIIKNRSIWDKAAFIFWNSHKEEFFVEKHDLAKKERIIKINIKIEIRSRKNIIHDTPLYSTFKVN